MITRNFLLLFLFFQGSIGFSQKALFWDKKSKKILDNTPEYLENFSIEEKDVIYEKIYNHDNESENFIEKFSEYLKKENNIKNIRISEGEIFGNLDELYISGPNAEGINTNNYDFENMQLGKKQNIRAGIKGWQMFFMSALYGKFKIQFKEDKYRLTIKNMWVKDINDENFDLEYWVLSSDKMRFADEFFNKSKSKRSENYLRVIQGYNIFLEEKFTYQNEIKKEDDW
tara:strand:+ start:1696 stop:2379 length:684 start_codon:yes stop_codon:yes gene_type:complete